VGKKQLFPQNGVCAFAFAFCGMCCLCGGVALLIPLSLVFVRGGEKQNFFLCIKIPFLQDNFWYLSSFS